MPSAYAPTLTAEQRAELADLQLVLRTASHNCGAALHGDELEESLRAALTMAEQAVAGLRRINAQVRVEVVDA